MSELTQKLQRLAVMRPGELAHRGREKWRAQVDRVLASEASGVPHFKHYLSGAPAARFYASHREDLRPFVRKNFPEWIERAVDEAERLCRHEVVLLGYESVELGPEIDWHRDPVTGRAWERRYWADYRLLNDNGGRDPKIIHELNRHQHLPRLAKAYLLTGNERYAEEAVAQMNGWIEQNPPGRGINWQSSLEIGIRSISWLWTIFPILGSGAFDERSAQRIGDSLFAQLEHVHRYPSVYTSPNTHLIGEAAALFIAGLVFQDRKRPAEWLRTAAALLSGAAKQVLDDGVYGELSSSYHCYALDFFLQAMVLARQNGFPLAESLSEKTDAMLGFLMHLTRPDGTLPPLGDDDGGRALALEQRNYRSFRDGLCVGAVLYGRGDFKHQARAFCEEALWILGRKGWEGWCGLESREPDATEACYPRAGYFVQRSGWGALDSHMVFDGGGLGMLTGGHAHADALSVTVFSGGREVLADPGTFVYNCAPEWRRYFRSTKAHNTVVIDGRDQAAQGSTFQWKTKIGARMSRQCEAHGMSYLEAEHDGYRPQGVIHRRRLLCVAPGHWIIVDDFRGSGDHSFEFHYHIPQGVPLPLRVFGSLPLQQALLEGSVSRGYGRKERCITLRATMTGPAPAAAITFLAPDAGEYTVRQVTFEGGATIACAYEHHGIEDVVVISTGGEFSWLRREGGRARDEKTLCAEFAAS